MEVDNPVEIAPPVTTEEAAATVNQPPPATDAPMSPLDPAEAPSPKENEGQEESTSAFMVYTYNVKQEPCRLLATTGSRYNTNVSLTLQAEADLIRAPCTNDRPFDGNNYFKNAKWSPDGTCLLTNSNDFVLRLFNLPYELYETIPEEPLDLSTGLGISAAESITDFAWFPSMTSQDPATCCFIATARDQPMQMWDAYTGKLRASYSVIDHRERFVGPNVVSFNKSGSHIYCGYENMIEIFDVQRPGQESTKLPTVPKRKSKEGLKGIISCMDFSADGLYAVGSYSQSVGIYDETNNELCLKLGGLKTGVTQVRFTPDGQYLFTASRTSDAIKCWDIRNTCEVLYELPRQGRTSQRLTFDLDLSGNVLVTGDQSGNVLFYDISTPATEDRLLSTFKGHDDTSSCATFNPAYPWLLASCSGQRKFTPVYNSESDSDDDDMIPVDNSLRIWHTPGQSNWFELAS